MSELTDDQLDKLFRKSAEEFEPVFDPAAWQDMNARLDTHTQTKTGDASGWKNALRWGVPTVLLFLLFVGGWYVYHQKNIRANNAAVARVDKVGREQTTGPNQSHSTKSVQMDAGEQPGGSSNRLQKQKDKRRLNGLLAIQKNGIDVENGRAKKRSDELVTQSMAEPKLDGVTKSVQRPYSRVNQQTRGSYQEPTQLRLIDGKGQPTRSRRVYAGSVVKATLPNSIKRNLTRISEEDYATIPAPAFTQQRLANQAEASVSDVSPGHPLLSESAKTADLPAIAELSIRPAQWFSPVAAINRPVIAQPDTVFRRVVSSTDVMRGLSVRFVVSPDLSAVGLKNFTRPGTNVGLLLEYRLATRWSVQTGVMQSMKVYKAATSDYDLPDYVTKWTVQPLGVDGTCNMIDIPLNIRYDVALRPRQNGQAPSRWFVSGGVTSYIMKQEDYVYQYADPTSPHIYPKNRGWSGKTGAYGFSELNLSAGYERAISRRFSWQVEPYLKVPLKGVGYYKINLLSTGGFFSLRYKF